jgi:serine protease Do
VRHINWIPPSFRTFRVVVAALVLSGLLTGPIRAKEKPASTRVAVPALEKPAPEGVADLKAIQEQVKKVLKKVIPATVGLQVGPAAGSGVIIDAEGHILTAGHVAGTPGRPVIIIFPDGKRVKGKTLGVNGRADSGMILITDKGNWPHVEMGNSADLKRGQWVVATGHPGGYHRGRSPVVRVGRVLQAEGRFVQTDCALVGGDSGGPLFDMEGRVIAIHSRIGREIEANLHVPVDIYRDGWKQLALLTPYIGIKGDNVADVCKIGEVVSGSPAEKAGLKAGDVILRFNEHEIKTFDDLFPELDRSRIGQKVRLEVKRDGGTVKLELTLGKRDQ